MRAARSPELIETWGVDPEPFLVASPWMGACARASTVRRLDAAVGMTGALFNVDWSEHARALGTA